MITTWRQLVDGFLLVAAALWVGLSISLLLCVGGWYLRDWWRQR